MPSRKFLIEQYIREAYGGQPSDDVTITFNLVNAWLNEGVASAAKAAYKEAIQIDGSGYVNNSFYATFSGIKVITDSVKRFGYYQAELPQIALGLGRNEGIGSIRINTNDLGLSSAFIPVSENELEIMDGLSLPPNVFYFSEGNTLYLISKYNLASHKLIVRMVSGGDANDLDAQLNCPADYLPLVREYVVKAILNHRIQRKDTYNDSQDIA